MYECFMPLLSYTNVLSFHMKKCCRMFLNSWNIHYRRNSRYGIEFMQDNKILIANIITNSILFPWEITLSYILLQKLSWRLLFWFAMEFRFLFFVLTLLQRNISFGHRTKTQTAILAMEETTGNYSSPKTSDIE